MKCSEETNKALNGISHNIAIRGLPLSDHLEVIAKLESKILKMRNCYNCRHSDEYYGGLTCKLGLDDDNEEICQDLSKWEDI